MDLIDSKPRVLILVKPDALLRRNVSVDILKQILDSSGQYTPLAFMEIVPQRDLISQHYANAPATKKKLLIDYLTSYKVIAIIIGGTNIVAKAKTMRNRMRNTYQIDNFINTIDTSESISEAKRQISLWMPHFQRYYNTMGDENSENVIENTQVVLAQMQSYCSLYEQRQGMYCISCIKNKSKMYGLSNHLSKIVI